MTMMRPLVFLAAVLCLLAASPVKAVEEERFLQESSSPSMATPVESFAPSASPGDSTAMPTEEATSGSFKSASLVAGAVTAFAFAGYF